MMGAKSKQYSLTVDLQQGLNTTGFTTKSAGTSTNRGKNYARIASLEQKNRSSQDTVLPDLNFSKLC